jgi:polysaccharide export outer membrane protein
MIRREKMRKTTWITAVLLFFVFSGSNVAQENLGYEYKIGPKDLLELKVIGFEDLNSQYRVSEEGKISVPYLGEVAVENLTKGELEKKLTELLQEKYLQNPQVTVVVLEYRSRRVFLLGAVVKPGPYELVGRLTLLKILSLSGGLTSDAGNEIIVTRQLPDGNRTSLKIPVDDLMLKGDPSLDIPLNADDIINVPVDKTVLIYITGQVRTPGALQVRRSGIPTLLRAIAQAGGFDDRASKGGVVIKRTDETGKETEIKVDVGDIMKGKIKDVPLQEGDVVIVPEKWI